MSKYALILCLDKNKENKYEYECFHCIESWKNADNILSDIDIIVSINNNVKVSAHTLDKLHQYRNIHIRTYSYDYRHVLLNKPYCLYLFEKNENKYEYGIFIDLDLYLKSQFPENLFFQNKNVFCIYTENSDKSETLYNKRFSNNEKLHIPTFNSELVIVYRPLHQFSSIIDIVNSKDYEMHFCNYILQKNDDYYYEEGIYDYAKLIGIINQSNSILIDINVISGSEQSFFIHKHIKSLAEYMRITTSKQT